MLVTVLRTGLRWESQTVRNLLLVHLESLNYTTYRTNRHLFPTLWEWEKRSLSFTKYFSTATSTLMVVSDMVYGGMLQYELCDTMISGVDRYCYQSSFLDDLKREGYRVKAINYPITSASDVGKANERHFTGYDVEMEGTETYEPYLQALDEALTVDAPFAVLACNYIGNIGYYRYMEYVGEKSGFEFWESSCVQRDRCVKDLMNILERKGLLENTTILFYGDHGDDICAHGRHHGLLHVFEPYASLIHTPFWIYDSRLAPGEMDTLLDVTDIRPLIGKLLQSEVGADGRLRPEDWGLPYRKYSMARNGYAAQKVRERSFHKGYSLTDGTFLFMAGDRGMELFHIWMDEGCQHNLLDYFDYKNGVLSLNESAYNSMKYHIKSILDEGALSKITEVFYEFREQLMQKAGELYQYADCPYFALEIDCENICYGWEERERRAKIEARRNPVSETLNYCLNETKCNRLTVYGEAGRELDGLYPAVTLCRCASLEEADQQRAVYIALQKTEQLDEVKPWIDAHKETSIFVYERETGSLHLMGNVPVSSEVAYDWDNREEFDLYGRYLYGKRIAVYGAGVCGRYFYEEMAERTDIIAWVDQNYAELPWRCCMEIQSPELLKELTYDAVFIAIANVTVKRGVKRMLMEWGIPEEKIV